MFGLTDTYIVLYEKNPPHKFVKVKEVEKIVSVTLSQVLSRRFFYLFINLFQ